MIQYNDINNKVMNTNRSLLQKDKITIQKCVNYIYDNLDTVYIKKTPTHNYLVK